MARRRLRAIRFLPTIDPGLSDHRLIGRSPARRLDADHNVCDVDVLGFCTKLEIHGSKVNLLECIGFNHRDLVVPSI